MIDQALLADEAATSLALADEPDGLPFRTAEVLIDGEPLRLGAVPLRCSHSETLVLAEPIVAFIQNEEGSAVEAWELKVRVRCGDCGLPFAISPQGRPPRDGSAGLVLTLNPVPE